MLNNRSTENSKHTDRVDSVVGEGRNVEDATAKALEALNATREMVEVEVLEEQGIIGTIFGKKAKVRVTRKGSLGEQAVRVIEKILGLMGIDATVGVEEADGGYRVEIRSKADGLLIGRRGETLAALQHIVWRILGKSSSREDSVERVVVDVSGYRRRRERQVREMALRWARRVESSGEKFTSESMTAAERRIVHMALRERKSVKTFSVGKGQDRKVVIAPAGEVDNARGSS